MFPQLVLLFTEGLSLQGFLLRYFHSTVSYGLGSNDGLWWNQSRAHINRQSSAAIYVQPVVCVLVCALEPDWYVIRPRGNGRPRRLTSNHLGFPSHNRIGAHGDVWVSSQWPSRGICSHLSNKWRPFLLTSAVSINYRRLGRRCA